MWDDLYVWASQLAPEKWMVLGAAVTIAAGAAMFITRPMLMRIFQNWQIRRRVARMGHEVLADAVLPDGLGHDTRVDYLVRSERGVTVVAVRRYPGVIFAAENMELWVQVLKDGSHKFANPLPGLRRQVAAVRTLVPNVPVDGVLLFAQGSRFPKGKPREVVTLAELREQQRVAATAALSPELERGWERLRLGNH